MEIRTATESDAAAIAEIYNDAVLNILPPSGMTERRIVMIASCG